MANPPLLADRFEIGERVAVSGMSEVWLAKDSKTGQQVAVKIPVQGLDPEIGRAAIDREAEALERMQHRSIPSLVSRFDSNDQPGIVLEWFDGVPLETFRGRPIEEMLTPLIGLADALSHAHNRGVIHRDLKPSNVIVDEAGRPALIDFGIAALLKEEKTSIRGGGTRGHASPQQFAGDTPEPADDLYAFGALVADLLIGGNRGLTPDTVPLNGIEYVLRRAVHPVPAKLEVLVGQLLASQPEERPRSFDEVSRRLVGIRQDQLEVTRPPNAFPTGRLAPVAPKAPPLRVRAIAPPRNPAKAGQTPTTQRSSGTGLLVVVSACVLAVGLVVVFWLLPRWIENRPATRSPATVEATSAPESGNPGEANLEEIVRKTEMEWRSLKARSVGLWAPVRSRELDSQLKLTRDLVENGSVEDAVFSLEKLQADFVELNILGQELVVQAIDEAKGYLQTGKAGAAGELFERALRIDPDSSKARQGLGDAANLQEALRALERGAGFEKSGDMASAAAQYRLAQQKAPWFAEAKRALARVQQDKRETEYARVLSEGLVALEAGAWERAESALAKAGSLKPGAPEVEDALLRLNSRRRLQNIERLQNNALLFETQEAWPMAAATYSKILEYSPASLMAEEGRQRALERAELDERLKGHLAHPDRLSEKAVLNDARSLVATAEDFTATAPRLQQQVHQLEHLVQLMSTPVPVEVLSDGLTEVTIYRVGQLGRFENRIVEIPPGSYTVVGARSGFKDVRMILEVRPGERPPPFAVRCEDAF